MTQDTQDEDRETSARGSLITFPVRLLLRWVIKTFVVLFMGIRMALRPRTVRYGLVALLVVAAIGWKFTSGSVQNISIAGAQSTGTSGATVSTPATNQLPPSQTVERYLQAQANFDGKGMWDLLSDDMKNSMQANSGATLQQLQQQLDAAKQQGRRYTSATYVGGVPMSDGQNVYFYVLRVEAPNGSAEVPYIYIVGTDSKIASIQ